eukprot:1143834-Pelagomonas_calceolata.AAC.4
MLCRLNVYARKKHVIINTVESQVVHVDSKGTLNMAESAQVASRAMLTSANRVHYFACEQTLADRLHASLWLAKTYIVPAGMCACQYDWFRAAVKLFNSMLGTNSITIRRVLQADLKLQSKDDHSVQYAFKLASTRRALKKTFLNSRHQDQAWATASNPPDPH